MERRLAAIVVADVVGYSRLVEADEASAVEALKARWAGIVQPLAVEHRGRVVKFMGDGVLLDFASATDALECAISIQRRMHEGNEGTAPDRRIDLRLGINLGDVVIDGADIQGDGVNIAARLEGLAEPGGICISGGVYEQVVQRVGATYDDLGEQSLKNISRPIRAYRVNFGGRSAPLSAPTSSPAKLTIAVLPFVNNSGDPGQKYLADGITENIIAELSRFRDLFVIASNSAFTYRGTTKRIQDLCRELGVRYALEGSIQCAGGRVRVMVQLVDGVSGRHLWSERYDRPAADVFKVQDDVAEAVVGTLATAYGGRLRKAWRTRAEARDSRSIEALDYFQRGVEQADRFTAEGARQARDLLHKAISADPNYGKAYAKLAWCHLFEVIYDWTEDVSTAASQAMECASSAVERDDDEAWGHWVLGACYMILRRDSNRALAEYQKAAELNPNDADVLAGYGSCLAFVGRAGEGLDVVRKAMRLNPHHPEWYTLQLGQILFDAREYSQSIAAMSGLRHTETIDRYLYLAASHAALAEMAGARAAVARLLVLNPRLSIAHLRERGMAPYLGREDEAHFLNALRKAGLPEGA